MPEPQQKDLLSGRWRKVPRVDPLEFALQIAFVQHLRFRCRPGVVYFHVPNGELRSPAAGAKLKAMGTLPGVADLVFIWDDGMLWDEAGPVEQRCTKVLFLELKAYGRKQSPEQEAFAQAVTDAGAHYRVADSIDTALAVLKNFNLLKG